MATKGQKFRKWSFEEKLRIVRRHVLEHVSVIAYKQIIDGVGRIKATGRKTGH